MLSSKVYDFLKDLTMIYLPAAATLYFTLSQIWGLPYGEQIVGTVAAVCTFLGVCLKISNTQYKNNIEVENINSNYAEAEPVKEEKEV